MNEGRTDSLSEATNEERARIFPCEQCGADLEFGIQQQRLSCPYCGFERDLTFEASAAVMERDFDVVLQRLAESRLDDAQASDLREIGCDSCGATVRFDGTVTSTSCGFCGSPVQLDEAVVAPERLRVDGVLPFQVEKEQARQRLAAWVKSRWFAPGDFKQRGVQGKFNGVYLPFWTFDSHTSTDYVGQRGEHYWVTVGSGKNKRRERRTRWYPASGSFRRFFDDVLVIASTGLPRKLLRNLEPWPLKSVLPFNKELLAGHLAQTYEVELPDGFEVARERMNEALYAEVCQRIGGDTQRVHSINSIFDPITFKHLLLPVWLLAYQYKGERYQVVVNAVTGEVQGERPWSWIKITLAILGVLAVVATIALIASAR